MNPVIPDPTVLQRKRFDFLRYEVDIERGTRLSVDKNGPSPLHGFNQVVDAGTVQRPRTIFQDTQGWPLNHANIIQAQERPDHEPPPPPPPGLIVQRRSHEWASNKRAEKGRTVWYTSELPTDIAYPPPISTTLALGDLYVHKNTSQSIAQIWLWKGEWSLAAFDTRVPHPNPIYTDRLLRLRQDGSPSWVSSATVGKYETQRAKKAQEGGGA
ncbi:hypothetical protein ARMGADRAFT_1034938 [Armillaria gallica]|uniref:Uncharacterized protein n=1 Tax=Armillaria gallica TaxID=47427 RepID=A0A2H3D0X8_ARMGA|nr:hypothetical protein ARMGADRAFT_1034938 [Armillaria gallica]